MPFNTRRQMLFLVGGVVSLTIVVTKKERLRAYVSSFCEWLSDEPSISTDVVRDAFTTTPVDLVASTPGHTHATAAQLRSSATAFASNIAQYCGSDVYVVGLSRSDQRRDMKGSRQWYWAKDVNTNNELDQPSDRDVRYLCDVDYYVDMPQMLANEAKPVLLYTVVPENVISVGQDDTSFHFDEDGNLVTYIAGGGKYSHMLWNYAGDSLLSYKTFCGVPYKCIAYSVERKQVAQHRQVVLLAPIREFYGLGALLAFFLLGIKPLERFDPIVVTDDGQKFVRFYCHKKEGTYVNTARPGSWVSAHVPADVDDAIATVARLGTTNLMLPTTASWIKDDRLASAVLTEFHRLKSKRSALTVFPLSKAVRDYQYDPSNYNQDARPKLQAFMSPLVHGAFCPVPNEAGEKQCVEGRIKSLRRPEPGPSRFRDRCIDEFASLVMQDVHLEPVCFDAVNEKQTSASQQLSLAKAVLTGQFRQYVLKCFIKAESYGSIKDPRNISTYNDADKLDMAQFALALSEHCKQFAWYGPGKTPVEIAQRVSDICTNADYVNISDYHRMDGTITYTLRRVERAICMKAFASHGTKLNELLKTNADNKGYLPFGTTFDQGPSHGSGCSATSTFQTLRATFTSYLAFRNKRKPCGNPYSPEEAFAALGIHLGDDGVDAELPPSNHDWAAKRVGLILEANVVHRGDFGVNFLARYYSPFIWDGCLDSMCDVKRQLSKFHTTVRLPDGITAEQKLVEKAMSYVATDGNTPVIGPLCKSVLLLSSYRPRTLLGLGNWWSKFEASVQYPNSNVAGWMDVEYEKLFPEFDRRQFDEWLDSCGTISQLLSPPLCAEPCPASPTCVPVVVDEDVLSSKSKSSDTTSSGDEKRARRKRPRRSGRKPNPKDAIKSG